MLEGLDQIDWARLTHAYGTAEEVPGWIRNLTSDDPKTRQKACEALHANICHQGSRYRSSAPAVPFVFEVLEARGAADRGQIIGLLLGLAVGYPEWHVPLGFDPAEAFADLATLGDAQERERIRASDPAEEDDWEEGRLALWKYDAYHAVLRRIEAFRALARDPERHVRMAAIKALAWFPEAAEDSARLVRDVRPDLDEPGERANAILCLGIVDRYLGDQTDVPRLVEELAPDRPRLVRIVSAISLAVILGETAPAACLTVLLEAIQDPRGTNTLSSDLLWHWLGLTSHACEAILLIKPGPDEETLAALCRAAEAVYETMGGADVFHALLSVVIADPSGIPKDPRTGFRRFQAAGLTADQKRALRAIGRSPVWEMQPYFYGRLMDIGLEYGLPWDPPKFKALLEEMDRVPE